MTGVGPNPDGDPFCNDPTHDDACDCGARPDYEYERRIEDR
jgi:hypothetical protein